MSTNEKKSIDFWPGYVDAMVNILLNLLFLAGIFTIGLVMFNAQSVLNKVQETLIKKQQEKIKKPIEEETVELQKVKPLIIPKIEKIVLKPKEEIKRYRKDVESLEEDFLKFDYAPEYSDPVARLSELQKMEDGFATSLVTIDRKIQNIEKTIRILGGHDNQSYLSDELRAIYEFAGANIDGVIKEFDEVINFHANLVSRKKEFLREDLPDLLNEKEEIESELATIYREKTKVFADMRSTESIANITEKLRNLGSLKVSLGKLEGLLDQQQKASEDLNIAETELQRILSEIKTEMESVYLFESEFSKKFQALTKEILGQEYTATLNYNEESGISNLEVSGGVSNPEGGKKKAEVISFDFSYIHTANKLQIKRPLFVFHDSIEDIDQRQIDTIFSEANKLPGQQIISMLADSLSEDFYKKYLPDTVLLLSEDDKFFKL